jgi:hypothetical protein
VRMPSRRGSKGWSSLPKAHFFSVISRGGGHMVVMAGGDDSGLCICGRAEMLGCVDRQREASEAGGNGTNNTNGLNDHNITTLIEKSMILHHHKYQKSHCYVLHAERLLTQSNPSSKKNNARDLWQPLPLPKHRAQS